MCPLAARAAYDLDRRSFPQHHIEPADELRAMVTLPPAAADRPPIDFDVWLQHVQFERSRDPQVRNALFAHYAAYARNLAAGMFRNGETSREELEQIAAESLLRALDRFEVDRRLPFEAYARPTIIGTLKRHFRDQGWAVRVPRRVHELAGPTRDVTERLTQKLARVPLAHEVAHELGTGEGDILEARVAMDQRRTVAMDATIADDDGADQWSRFGGSDAGFAAVENHLALADAMAQLTDLDRQLIALYFEDGLTQTEIGDRIGTSQMQVSRLLRNLIRRLRADVCA